MKLNFGVAVVRKSVLITVNAWTRSHTYLRVMRFFSAADKANVCIDVR